MHLTDPTVPAISIQEYLEGELVSETKHEYIAGYVYAMAGASKNHQRIVANLMQQFGNHLEQTPCESFSSDLKLKADQHFFYPDVMVVCQADEGDDYYTETPILVVEVLSKTTRKQDHTLKRRAYQNLPSVQEYVLIEQDFVAIEVCRRAKQWRSEYYFLGDEIDFASIDCRLSVATIYARVANEDMREFLAQGLD